MTVLEQHPELGPYPRWAAVVNIIGGFIIAAGLGAFVLDTVLSPDQQIPKNLTPYVAITGIGAAVLLVGILGGVFTRSQK